MIVASINKNLLKEKKRMQRFLILGSISILVTSCAPSIFEEYGLEEKIAIQEQTMSSCLSLKVNINKELKKLGFLDYRSDEYISALAEASTWSDLYYKICNGVTFND